MNTYRRIRTKELAQNQNIFFAVKKCSPGDRSAFDREVEAAERIGWHEHITVVLATYHLRNAWYLVMPWADENLRTLWQRFDKPLPGNELVTWIAEQCAGIASGLRHIQHSSRAAHYSSTQGHLSFGTYGDLKPENVLWFPESPKQAAHPGSGTLRITGFGRTSFHQVLSVPIVNTHGVTSNIHQDPEIKISNRVSPAADIWSLGSLLLEFATWYLKGWEGVDTLSHQRLEAVFVDGIEKYDPYDLVPIENATVTVRKPSVTTVSWPCGQFCSRNLQN